MSLKRIVSGGQTGVDRGALDAALDAEFPCGGWCPQGRLAEDGAIPERYPLVELARASYGERTVKNVLDGDGTAIIHCGNLEGGTRQTSRSCAEHHKPCEVIDAEKTPPLDAARRLAAFIAAHDIATLNVAGPRASKWPGARDYAYEVVRHLIRAQNEQGSG